MKKGLTSFFNNAIDMNKLEESNEKNLILQRTLEGRSVQQGP